jgi:hypothetical protein
MIAAYEQDRCLLMIGNHAVTENGYEMEFSF